MKKLKLLSQITFELRQFFATQGCVTSAAIARKTGINQSQVYRNLFATPRRFTRTHLRLCEYAKIDIELKASDPRSNAVLMGALDSIWDGTDIHAHLLAELLFAHSRAGMRK